MTKSNKYSIRVVKDKQSWLTEIVRRVTSKKFHVSKSQGGFTTESEALAWGKKEIESFVKSLNEKNKRV